MRVFEPVEQERVFEPVEKERVFEPIKQERVFEPAEKIQKNKTLIGDFVDGGWKGQNDLWAGINGLFADSARYWGGGKDNFVSNLFDRSKILAQMKSNRAKDRIQNEWAGLAGEAILDPSILIPVGGAVAKGIKGVKASKQVLKAGVGVGTLGASDGYIRGLGQGKSEEEARKDALLQGTIGAVAGGALASGIPQQAIVKGYKATKQGASNGIEWIKDFVSKNANKTTDEIPTQAPINITTNMPPPTTTKNTNVNATGDLLQHSDNVTPNKNGLDIPDNPNIGAPTQTFLERYTNGAIGNQLGSSLSGGIVGAMQADRNPDGSTNWGNTMAWASIGALGGLGLKNAKNIPRYLNGKKLAKFEAQKDEQLASIEANNQNLARAKDELNKRFSPLFDDAMARGADDEISRLSKDYQSKINSLDKQLNSNEAKKIEVDSEFSKQKEGLNSKKDGGWADISKGDNKLDNLIKWGRENFTNTLSDDYKAIREEAKASVSLAERERQELSKALNGLSDEERIALQQYMSGGAYDNNLKNMSNLQKARFDSVAQKLDDYRARIDTNTDEMVKLGLLSKEAGDEFKGLYLKRLYEGKGKFKDQVKNTMFGSNSDFELDKIHQRGKAVDVSPDEFNQLMRNGMVGDYGTGDFAKGKYVIEKGYNPKTDKITLRRDYTPDERVDMKEINDIAHSLPDTLYSQQEKLAHAKLLQSVKNLSKTDENIIFNDKLYPNKTADEIAQKARDEGFEKLNGSKYGALNGQYVRRDVAQDIKRIHNDLYTSDLMKAYTGWLNAWKKSKTVYNMKSHVNNLASNFALMTFYGFNPAKMAKEIGTLKNAGRYNELLGKQKIGVLNWLEKDELIKLAPSMRNYDEAVSVGLLGRGNVLDNGNLVVEGKGLLNKTAKFAQDMYQNEDNIARLAVFKQLRDRGYTIEQAKQGAIKFLPDYTQYMPQGIRLLKDSGLSPFIAWSYYVMPNIIREMGTGVGATRFSLAMAGYYAIQQGLNEFSNMRNVPTPDENFGKYLNISRNGDTVTRVKVDRMVPFLELARDPVATFGGLASNPAVQAGSNIIQATTGKPVTSQFTGRSVTRDSKSGVEQAYDYMKYGIENYTPIPAQFTSGLNLIESFIRPQEARSKNSVYVPRNTPQEILNFLGLNTSNYSIKSVKKEKEDRKKHERRKK